MNQPAIIDGTPDELADYLARHPDRKFRLIEIAEPEASGVTLTGAALNYKAKTAIALLDKWIAEGKAAGEETRREADREVEELKRNLTANRAATGEKLVFP